MNANDETFKLDRDGCRHTITIPVSSAPVLAMRRADGHPLPRRRMSAGRRGTLLKTGVGYPHGLKTEPPDPLAGLVTFPSAQAAQKTERSI
jgi:hypothetical protein